MSGNEVESPCTSVCLMQNGICSGCGMTEKESNTWYKLDNDERQKIVDRLEKEKQKAEDN